MDYFKVITENDACPRCSKGETFSIVYMEDDDLNSLSTTYEDREQANDICSDLNFAFDLGCTNNALVEAVAQTLRAITQHPDKHPLTASEIILRQALIGMVGRVEAFNLINKKEE